MEALREKFGQGLLVMGLRKGETLRLVKRYDKHGRRTS